MPLWAWVRAYAKQVLRAVLNYPSRVQNKWVYVTPDDPRYNDVRTCIMKRRVYPIGSVGKKEAALESLAQEAQERGEYSVPSGRELGWDSSKHKLASVALMKFPGVKLGSDLEGAK